MQTNCVIFVGQDSRNAVLGMVIGEASVVRGAIQQYQKAVGPLTNRAAFNDFVQQNQNLFKIDSCVPIDTTQI
jgi:excinuclease UvrABC nuclease subunit